VGTELSQISLVIGELARANARSVEEIATTSEHLYHVTEELNQNLGRFHA
jgi:methyl-accepting chemotaxis protein